MNKKSCYTTQELTWFPKMLKAGWLPKRKNCMLSGVFFLWTHKETGATLDERRYFGNNEILNFHLSKNTTPDKNNPLKDFIPAPRPLFKPM